MTRGEAIKIFESWAECKYEPTRQAAELAVAALRAQQTTAKLDRSRWNGCGFCNKINPSCLKDIMYCGKCGRPLTEEAWAELERRINGGTTDNE